jgi:hypothetical protein
MQGDHKRHVAELALPASCPLLVVRRAQRCDSLWSAAAGRRFRYVATVAWVERAWGPYPPSGRVRRRKSPTSVSTWGTRLSHLGTSRLTPCTSVQSKWLYPRAGVSIAGNLREAGGRPRRRRSSSSSNRSDRRPRLSNDPAGGPPAATMPKRRFRDNCVPRLPAIWGRTLTDRAWPPSWSPPRRGMYGVAQGKPEPGELAEGKRWRGRRPGCAFGNAPAL